MEVQGGPEGVPADFVEAGRALEHMIVVADAFLREEDELNFLFFSEAMYVLDTCKDAPVDPVYSSMSIELQALVRDAGRKVEDLRSEIFEVRKRNEGEAENDRAFRIIDFYGRKSGKLLADFSTACFRRRRLSAGTCSPKSRIWA